MGNVLLQKAPFIKGGQGWGVNFELLMKKIITPEKNIFDNIHLMRHN